MHSEVTEAGPFERLLTLHIDDADLEVAKNATARRLSQKLKIKGFRPGKAPRSIVERMVGSDSLRAEAVDEALPALVGRAVEESELEPVTMPAVQDIRNRTDGGIDVDVKITLWPELAEIPDTARTVEVELPEVEDDELDAQIDRVRSQYADLDDVLRPAGDGDFVLLDLSATSSLGTPIEAVAATDLLYELGSRSYIPGLDEILDGVAAGDITQGPVVLPEGFGDRAGTEVTLRVLVKGVKARRLPELTDEWVSDVSEFDSVAEFREMLRVNLTGIKRSAARGAFRERVLDQMLAEVDLDIPDALVDAETETSLHNLAHSLQGRGLDLASYLSVTGQDQEEFVAELRAGAERSLKVRVLLEAVAASEGIEVTNDDLRRAIDDMAASTRRDRDEFASFLASSGQERALAGDILRRRALDRIMEASAAVDAAGNPVDLTGPPHGDDDLDPEGRGNGANGGSPAGGDAGGADAPSDADDSPAEHPTAAHDDDGEEEDDEPQ